MGDLTARDGVPEGARDVLLADDCGEGLGAVAAIKGGTLRHASMVLGVVVHPPSITTSRTRAYASARIRLACGTKRRPLTAASFRI
jgi:hypothetical protein